VLYVHPTCLNAVILTMHNFSGFKMCINCRIKISVKQNGSLWMSGREKKWKMCLMLTSIKTVTNTVKWMEECMVNLTLRLLMSYIYGAPSKARNANVVYIRTYIWQRWNSLFLFAAQCFDTESMQRGFLCHLCV